MSAERRRVRAYRRLLAAYPGWWRVRHADVVIGTLLEVHAASGTRRPSVADLVAFTVDGVRVRVRARVRPGTRAPLLPPLVAAGHVFDQGNRTVVEHVLTESEQRRANAVGLRDSDEQRVAAVAFVGMNAVGGR